MKKVIYLIAALALMLIGLTTHAQERYSQPTTRSALVQWVMDNAHDAKMTVVKASWVVSAAVKYAKTHDLDPLLVLSVMKNESGFRTKAKSPYGATGLMQVVPRWHKDKLRGRSPNDPDVSVEVGTQILSDCFSKFNGHPFKALGCYSGGGGLKYYAKIESSHKAINRTMIEQSFLNELPIPDVSRLTRTAILMPPEAPPVQTATLPPMEPLLLVQGIQWAGNSFGRPAPIP